MTSPLQLLLDRLGEAGCSPKRSGEGWSARCPAHEDRRPSLSVTEGSGGRALLKCQAGCQLDAVLAALSLTAGDLFASKPDDEAEAGIYDYVDEAGELLFQVVRFQGKRFRQRRPDKTKANGWAWNLNGVRRRPLYRLPQVIEAVSGGQVIYIAEGEKDCDALAQAGVCATCNPGGAGKWRPEHAQTLHEAACVVVLADRDDPGRDHADKVRQSLRGHVSHLVVAVALEGKDAFDHLRAGHSIDEFTVIYDSATPDEGVCGTAAPPGSENVQRRELPPPTAPMAVAREFLAARYTHESEALLLRHWRGGWWHWHTTHWAEIEHGAVREAAYRFTEHAQFLKQTKDGPELADWAPNRHKVADLLV